MSINSIDEAVSFYIESEKNAAKYINTDLPHSQIRNPQYVRELIERLGNPDLNQFNIKVTGSKGKGSVSKLIATILQSQGYKVGLFMGPHLLQFNERIRINDQAISDEDLLKYTNLIKPIRDDILSQAPKEHYMGRVGISLAAALKYFEDNKTDINVIELGIGAKYDEANNAHAAISVINPIFSEHLRELGGSFEAVADSKSYIIQEGQRATFWAKQDPLAQEILIKRTKEQKVPYKYYGNDFIAEDIRITHRGTEFSAKMTGEYSLDNLVLNMFGKHQAENAALALAVSKKAMSLKARTFFNTESLKDSLATINSTGRFEILFNDPLVVLDGAINRKCAMHVKETLLELGSEENIFIIGVPDDKDYLGTIEVLKYIASDIILTKAKNKSLHFNVNQYDVVARELGSDNLYYTENVEEAVVLASQLNDDKTLCIVGTQSLIGDTKKLINNRDYIEKNVSIAL